LILIFLLKKFIFQRKINFFILKKIKLLNNINNLNSLSIFNAQSNSIYKKSYLNTPTLNHINLIYDYVFIIKKNFLYKMSSLNKFLKFQHIKFLNYFSIITAPLELFKLLFDHINLHPDFLMFIRNNKFNEELKLLYFNIDKNTNSIEFARLFFNFFFFKMNFSIFKHIKLFTLKALYPKFSKLDLFQLSNFREINSLLSKNKNKIKIIKIVDKKYKNKILAKTLNSFFKIKLEILNNKNYKKKLNKLAFLFKSNLLYKKSIKNFINNSDFSFSFYNESNLFYNKTLVHFFRLNKFLNV
jgi:hypothetical protein